MKILRVIPSMNPSKGGPCQGIRNSIPELERAGISNEVVCLDAPSEAYLGSDPFVIHTLGPAKGPWSYSADLIPWLVKNLPLYDAVIIHGLWLFPSHATKVALDRLVKAKEEKIPRAYVMPHGMLDPYFQRDPSRRFKAWRNWLYWKLIEGKVVNCADSVLFTCEEELRLARESFSPYSPKRALNVGYGVADPPVSSDGVARSFRDRPQGAGQRPFLLFLSRIHPKKGVDLLIRAYVDLASRQRGSLAGNFPDLVIAGPLDSAYAREMQALAAELLSPNTETIPALEGDRPRIFFPGMLQGDEKWGAFHSCDAFILPSHQENFGIAVAEALACGKPVLISNKVNIWREIVSGGGGIAANDDLNGTIELIGKWLSMTTEERYGMGTKAHEVHASRFSIRMAAERLADVLKDGEEHRNSK